MNRPLRSWIFCLFLALTLRIDERIWQCPSLFIMNTLLDYSHGRGKLFNLLNRHLQEFRCCAFNTVSTIFFLNVNTAFILDEFLQKNFKANLENESGKNNLIWVCQCCLHVTNTLFRNMQPTGRHVFSNLNCYEY